MTRRLRKIRSSKSLLRILAFSDIRVQDIEEIVRWVRRQPKFDVIVYGGDDVHRFVRPPSTNFFARLASLARYGLVGVIGNDDRETARSCFFGRKVYEIHSMPLSIGRFGFLGLEGAPKLEPGKKDVGLTLYEEHDIALHLAEQASLLDNKTLIVVSHAPPRDCLDTAMRVNRAPIGSTALRSFIESNERVAVVICGHVHSCGGQATKLGNAQVLNVASHDNHPTEPARLGVVEISRRGCVQYHFIQLLTNLTRRQSIAPPSSTNDLVTLCSTIGDDAALHAYGNGVASIRELETNIDHRRSLRVSAVYEVGPDIENRLHFADIDTIGQLVDAAPERVANESGIGLTRAHLFAKRAQAYLLWHPVAIKPVELPRSGRGYIDIETDLRQSYCWLVGVIDDEGDHVQQFLAKDPTQEKSMLEEVSGYLQHRKPSIMLHFSKTQFDRRVLVKQFRKHGLDVPPILESSIDCQPLLARAIAIPRKKYGLKQFASCFGFRFRIPELDGMQVALQYERALQEKKPVPHELLVYNQDDVLALRFVVQRAIELGAESLAPDSDIPNCSVSSEQPRGITS